MILLGSASRTVVAVALLALPLGGLRAQEPYRLPPAPIPAILDAAPLPAVRVGPKRDRLLLMERPSMPSIAEMARPMLRLAGHRINPATNGDFRTAGIRGLELERVSDGSRTPIELPAGTEVDDVLWSPDGSHIAFTVVRDDGVELWVAGMDGSARRLVGPSLNATGGTPCAWIGSTAELLCRLTVEDRGPAPEAPRVPGGPTVQQTSGKAAPVRTYEDLLENAHDAALFGYYFTSRLARVDATTGRVEPIGEPAVFEAAQPSPDGRWILVRRVVEPYSYLVPSYDFPKEVEVWSVDGSRVNTIASLPLAENVPIRGVPTGPRSVVWRPLQDATLVWAEALDGGDPDRAAEHRDRLVQLAAPFTGEPSEWLRLRDRYAGTRWTADGRALVSEYDRRERWVRTWLAVGDASAHPSPRLVWDRSIEDVYGDPGDPLVRPSDAGEAVLVQRGEWIYLAGDGASPQGERPFLDRLSLKTLKSERLWRSEADHYEPVVALLDDAGRRAITRRESATEPPNYFVRQIAGGDRRALTDFQDPAPQLRGVEKRLVIYRRADGVPLSGELYLPPGYTEGTRLPVVIWAYPREFASADAAGQVRARPNRFTTIAGPSHLLLLTQGYAVFDGPSMPIIGGDTANNTYIEQLVADARAAVDRIVELGVADRDRIGIGGHSYGAFMTANLLAHSDLFRAGVARSGAYNRTLTPFGFQNETRTFWEAPEIYDRMSPFMSADSVDEPILLIHGEADDNSGTFPIQSERFYHAIKGLGGTARLVMLPHEAHGYRGRESVLHTVAEMVDWFDRYVKSAPPRSNTTSR